MPKTSGSADCTGVPGRCKLPLRGTEAPCGYVGGAGLLNCSIGEEVQDCGSFMNHGSASNAEDLEFGKMFHEDNIVVTQELALGIVATQELAMDT